MRFTSLGSGSKGNATLIESGDTRILVDCGFGLRDVESRLKRRGVDPQSLTAILVTHEHGDHLKGAPMLANRYRLPLYTTPGTSRSFKTAVATYQPINVHQSFRLGDIDIEPVTVPHDAREPSQFVFQAGDYRLGLLTDLGSVTPLVRDRYRHCQALLLECNHDPRMLAEGPYPPSLKRRVGGDWGHLSNQQAADLLASLDLNTLKHLMISHISEQNNHPDLARAALDPVLDGAAAVVQTLSQDEGCDWIDLETV
ncbi:MBL fold metallo-hydrolase [Saccharospirillum sp. MSK14-1]|uniref:MBL fold metallo-hydrolase n=1 Tax=Saccharospirillum sp. MSK14-1 TaxID=1897632 RepID=UPI000D3CC848|nr:MBL fold metallo-hydrolase [Saccharospirillum sp. MSK14-1]PTY37110.1 MBL fold metallo-hydrolase [Saccharospirillum sp. MSK14-1]